MSTPQPPHGVPQQPWSGGVPQQQRVQQRSAGPADDTGRPLAIIIAVWAIIAGLGTLISYPINMIRFWMAQSGYSTIPVTIAQESWNFLALLDAAALVVMGALLFARRHKARFFATAVIALTVALYAVDTIYWFIWAPSYADYLYDYFYSWDQVSGHIFYLIPAVLALLPGVFRTLHTEPKRQQPPRQSAPAVPHPAHPGKPQPVNDPARSRQGSGYPAPITLGTATLLVTGLMVLLTLFYSKNEIVWFVDAGVLLVLGTMLLTRTRIVKGVAVAGMAISVIAAYWETFEYGVRVYGWRTPLNVAHNMEAADGIMFYCSILVAMLVFLPSVLHSLRRKPDQRPPRQQYYYGMPSGY
ncbi:hypothetical protein [Actinopolyspora lacussalsi]|nr:hypothetical protein [Actinopolyspora righensis]